MFQQMNCADKLGQQKNGSLKIFSFLNSKGNPKPHSNMHPKERKAKANADICPAELCISPSTQLQSPTQDVAEMKQKHFTEMQ